MTTLINFQPSLSPSAPPFQFQATLDGAVYTVTAAWNFAAQRWYINIVDQFGNLIVNRPLIGSPSPVVLTGLSWASGKVTGIAQSFLGYKRASLVKLTVSGALPPALSGTFLCTIVGPTTFTYELDVDPGMVTATGFVSTDIDLVGGYFNTSTMVYRASTNNFEIGP